MAVGTPGRLCALAESGALPLAAVRLLVLDEADQLWAADGFRSDVQWLAAALPRGKQARAHARVGGCTPCGGACRAGARPRTASAVRRQSGSPADAGLRGLAHARAGSPDVSGAC